MCVDRSSPLKPFYRDDKVTSLKHLNNLKKKRINIERARSYQIDATDHFQMAGYILSTQILVFQY